MKISIIQKFPDGALVMAANGDTAFLTNAELENNQNIEKPNSYN